MMNEERMADELRAFYEEEPLVRPDRTRMAASVRNEIHGKPQARRSRWRLPSFKRTPALPPAMPATEYEPVPIPATNGHAPTVTGRTQSMFSPAKAITAGALVFALGGAFLIAQPFDQQGVHTPGAEAPFAAPVEVTGRFSDSYGTASPDVGDLETLPGVSWVFTNSGTVSASDPRLEGALTFITQEQMLAGHGLETSERLTTACEADPECIAEFGGPWLRLSRGADSIENDDGVWRQRPGVDLSFPGDAASSGETLTWVDVYDGEGAYDGLIAVLQFSDSGGSVPFYGFILDARQLPPVPENASAK